MYRLCASPPGLSQLTTSFIASQTQGIHHAPLVALKNLKLYCYPTTSTSDHQLLDDAKKLNVIDKKDRLSSNNFFWFFQYVKELRSICRYADYADYANDKEDDKVTNLTDLIRHILISLKELFHSYFILRMSYLLFLWRISESNRWPSACKADALANWANPPCKVGS